MRAEGERREAERRAALAEAAAEAAYARPTVPAVSEVELTSSPTFCSSELT